MKDYLSIKEFSLLSGIEQTTLRYWDDIGLFSPSRRDPENNYRYYTPEQMIAVNFIKVLSELNIPLKTISEMEKERTPESIVGLIEQQEKLLDMEMRRLRESYSIIHARRELINYGIKLRNGFWVVDGVRIETDRTADGGVWVDKTKIAVMHREEKVIILGPRNEWPAGEPFYEHFMKFCNMAAELRINLSFPVGGYHETPEAFFEAPGEPEYFFSMDPTGNRRRESGKYLIGFSEGYYGQFGDLGERMKAFAQKEKLTLYGPAYTMYLFDEICVTDPAKFLVQASIAVE